MKKLVSIVLSLILLFQSISCISFASVDSNAEVTFNLKTNLPLQNEPKKQELTTEEKEAIKSEKEAIKLENDINEKIKDSYSNIIEANPCMKVAVKEVQQIFANANQSGNRAYINIKLEQLKSEKDALIKYKKSLSESNFQDENVEKQIKNIDNRLQAIEYTENCLNNYLKENYSDYSVVAVILGLFVFWGLFLPMILS